ncbi:uncharacterized protein LOC134276912 [Saccostrea cucullata]|uniref:uncharacterized protein LOC134276912 n=1 Tax=Saccostrea cuccullata TaxID=36930 RepID=UPI002ED12C3D
MPASFYSQLEACLSKEQTLKRLISPYRYFEVECPPNSLTRRQQNLINHVKKCIVKTVQKLPHWGEKVPLKWFELENIINQKKANGEKVLKKQQLKETAILVSIDENDLNDVLCFLHDIGKIIYFHVDQLEETVIIDVQWFVDAFKYIITDEKHFARKDSENTLVNTGKISGQYIEEIWKNIQDNRDDNKHHDFILQSYLNHKYDILQYMDKLGLMTRIETQIGVIEEEEMYYIPSMNRTDLPYDRKDEISRQQKSPMMVYFFKSYLPHFFFFRLVVNCLKKWEVYDIESFFKNAVLYKADDADHYFVIGVSKTSIQLQVFTLEETMDLSEECVKKIRQTVEEYIKEITETFHKGIIYEMGFSCTDIKITEEDEKFFLKEEYIYKPSMRFEEISCPRHHFGQDRHKIDRNKMLMCRLQRKSASSPRDNLKWLSP